MRPFPLFLASIALLLLAVSGAQAQTGFDRPGGDYSNFTVRNGDPAQCAARCERDAKCRAWSFAYPTTRRPTAICWLKNQVTAAVQDSCCVSGVRGAGVVEPRDGKVEYGVDRVGGDYRSLEVAADARGKTCASVCEGDSRCRAWTYVRPGYAGASARCYLKDRVRPPRRKPCCLSGVVR